MARRSAVGHGREAALVEEAPAGGLSLGSPADPWEVPEQRGRRGGKWGGSGGRWWIWVGRAILWALILVILVNGIRAPFERFTSNDSGTAQTPKPSKGADFPSSSASAFAIQFATVYLNYDQRTAQARQTQLQSFIPDGADGNFGWNGVGALQVQSVQVAGVDARDANNAVVTVLARATDRWFRLSVPIYTKNGAMVVSSQPALLPPPTKATLPQSGVTDRDQALESELQGALGPFFQAYAQNNQSSLSRFADGVTITGLANSVTFAQVKEVVAPKGPAGERTITATVAWQVPGAAGGNGGELDQTYELVMVKKDANWFVRDIHGTTRPGPS
ncbi:conjugal transfer protein [Actinomadura barringtoniae]|uniref:Conjugal transfer protein n=1 Tax=Actinomadura barringtoniae TaxID=1427535 RepID=A0A939PCR9_9ACTN|nr:conjugal transfer protein [Actinomadura barringtoniae]MBO2446869.1 conjugal transfer protein [Actinomadura barringtoniae]